MARRQRDADADTDEVKEETVLTSSAGTDYAEEAFRPTAYPLRHVDRDFPPRKALVLAEVEG